jgi:hypothetical protein
MPERERERERYSLVGSLQSITCVWGCIINSTATKEINYWKNMKLHILP